MRKQKLLFWYFFLNLISRPKIKRNLFPVLCPEFLSDITQQHLRYHFIDNFSAWLCVLLIHVNMPFILSFSAHCTEHSQRTHSIFCPPIRSCDRTKFNNLWRMVLTLCAEAKVRRRRRSVGWSISISTQVTSFWCYASVGDL